MLTSTLFVFLLNRYLRIDGSMNSNERSQNIDAFQSSDKVRVFLLSVKATGVGITLTSASRVVIMDTGKGGLLNSLINMSLDFPPLRKNLFLVSKRLQPDRVGTGDLPVCKLSVACLSHFYGAFYR